MNRQADRDRGIQMNRWQANDHIQTDGLESFSQLLAAHLETEAMLAMLGIKVNKSF